MKAIEMKGKTFNRLTVIERDYQKQKELGSKEIFWRCQCSCENKTIVSVRGSDLRRGNTKSCGCLRTERIVNYNAEDLSNQRFGKLVALIPDNSYKELKELKNDKRYWKCLCDCGNTTYVTTTDLKSGHTYSCGCLRKSKGEYKIEQVLTKLHLDYMREVSFQDLIGRNGVPLRFDFLVNFENQSFLIEYQGQQHYYSIEYFGGEDKLKLQREYDRKKKEYCSNKGMNLIEIPYSDLDKIDTQYLLNILKGDDKNAECRPHT